MVVFDSWKVDDVCEASDTADAGPADVVRVFRIGERFMDGGERIRILLGFGISILLVGGGDWLGEFEEMRGREEM